jgi:hypothetical protein
MSRDELRVEPCNPPEMAVMVGTTKVILAAAVYAPRMDAIVHSGGSIAAVTGTTDGPLHGIPHVSLPAGADVLAYISIPRGVPAISEYLITNVEP